MNTRSGWAGALVGFLLFLLGGCATLEVGIERQPLNPIEAVGVIQESLPQVRAVQNVDVRKGWSTADSIVGVLAAGQTADVVARIVDGQERVWWVVVLPDGTQGMVYGELVEWVEDMEGVANIANLTWPTAEASSMDLGKVAYLQGGDIWVKALPDGEPQRLTYDGRNHSPRWSPSGEWLAYLQGEYDQLWLMRADGSDAYRVGPTLGEHVAWAPSAEPFMDNHPERLAYVSPRGLEILMAGATRAETLAPWRPVARIPQMLGDDESPPLTPPPTPPVEERRIDGMAWSPDGRQIAYLVQHSEVRIVQVESGDSQTIFARATPQEGELVLHGWSGDGRDAGRYVLIWQAPILAAAIWHGMLYAVPVAGGESILLAEDISRYEDFVRPAPKPYSWIAAVSGGSRETWFGKRLMLLTPYETASSLTSADEAISSPAWRPDGLGLVYVSMPDDGNWVGGEEARQAMMARSLWLLDGSMLSRDQPRQLTRDPAYRDEYPLWSADGSHILFARLDDDSRASLWLLDVESGALQEVVSELTPAPEWFGFYGYIREWPRLFDWYPGQPQTPTQPLGVGVPVSMPVPVTPPPPEPPVRTLGDFLRHLDGEMTAEDVIELWGEPDEILGSGLMIYRYWLEEDVSILLAFPGQEPIQYAHLEAPSGEIIVLPISGISSQPWAVASPVLPQSGIDSPALGAIITGSVTIIGTAVYDDFQKYELHYRHESDEDNRYIYFGGGTLPVVNGQLGIWQTTGLAPGFYRLRLRVVKNDGNYAEYTVDNLHKP